MTFFDIAILIVLVAVAVAACVGTASVFAGLRRRTVVVYGDGDCRETALIEHGEGVRADCE
ncbi:MAG: hypothetical protein KDB82_06605 [Planctomycetes bacterium]|nr:hypothetical protein [Planctomycetota bacterium]